MPRKEWVSAVIGLLVGAALLMPVSAMAAGPATPPTVPASGSGRAGAASQVNLSDAARYPDMAPPASVTARLADYRRDHPTDQATQPQPPSQASKAVPAASAANLVPHITNSFDSIVQNQANSCGGSCRPSATVATSGVEFVETANTFIQVHKLNGGVLCNGGVTLNRLLRTTDLLFDPKIQYDLVNRRFSLLVTVFPANSTAPAAMWVAASDTADACGTWRTFRLFFNNGAFPPGSWPTAPSLGQDTNALLIATTVQADSGFKSFDVFGLPKSTVYSGGQLSFTTFATNSEVAAVTNAGQPMVTSPASYFVGSVRNVGYVLYRLSNSGGSGAVLTLQATINAPFSSPTRGAQQPGLRSGLTPTFGEIASGPYYDGRSVWFTHEIDASGHPTVLYGAIDTLTNGASLGLAKRSTTSDDVMPSLAVGRTSSGPVVYLSWIFTDQSVGIAASLMVNGLAPGQPVTNLVGNGGAFLFGSVTNTGFLFGGYSSTSIDPRITNGGCAVTTQQYFAVDGTWKTRIARMGGCPTV